MKKIIWFYLSFFLVGMTMSNITWGDRYRHDHNHDGHAHQYHNHSSHHHHYRPRRSNFSLGIGLGGMYGSYGNLGYFGRNVGLYGDFAYGRGYYPRYPRSYYRPYYRPYGYMDNYYWSAYPSIAYPPVVVVPSEPPVYIQQQPAPPTPPASAAINYWYYCENPAGYYPKVERCPNGWIKVPPTPAQ